LDILTALTARPYRFLLRMPEELRGRLSASADEAGRSLNSEVVRRLEQSFGDGGAASTPPKRRLRWPAPTQRG
jgi:hypothetical protein